MQQLQEGKEAHLEAVASANAPGRQLKSAIVLDGLNSRNGSAQLEGGDDSEIELLGPPRASTGGIELSRLRSSTSSHETNITAIAAIISTPENSIRLRLRGGPSQQLLVAVPKNRTIASLIKHYLKKADLDVGLDVKCRIVVDGEDLPHSSKIEDHDFEDEEILDIRVPS